MNPEISIIVPVFNTASLLADCLDSILGQTFSDFELILVNDGSYDGSGEICDRYSLKDERVKVIHQVNGGVSSARNAGLNVARGKYIGWVDSDDWIEASMFHFLYNLAEEHNAEVSECDYATYAGDTFFPSEFGKSPEAGDKDFLLKKYLVGDIFYGLVTKLFRRQLFENVRFPVGRIWEDAWFITYLCFEGVIYVRNPQVKYYYRQSENSIVRSIATPKKAREAIYLLESSLKLIDKKIFDPVLRERLIIRNMEKGVLWYLGLALDNDPVVSNIYSKIYLRRMDFGIIDCIRSGNILIINKISYVLCRLHLSKIVRFFKKLLKINARAI